LRADTGSCNGQSLTLPFTDVQGNPFFCQIAAAYFSGLTTGTTATTYSPAATVTREQMAAFITRTQDSALKRGSRRAAAEQWWTPQHADVVNRTFLGPTGVMMSCFDGADLWVANSVSDSVYRVRASDGSFLGTWTGANSAASLIAAGNYIYVTGAENPGKIYVIFRESSSGSVTVLTSSVGAFPRSITFDGLNLWTANAGTGSIPGSISRYNLVTHIVTTFTTGFDRPASITFDGTHLWVVDAGAAELYRVNPAFGTIFETIFIGIVSSFVDPVFDGTNLWVPADNMIKVFSTSSPARVLATLTGNGLNNSRAAAFDGERIMVTNDTGVSLWKASSLTPLGNLNLGSAYVPRGVCSDGLNFWISADVSLNGYLLRF
jgi:hypothetical protein